MLPTLFPDEAYRVPRGKPGRYMHNDPGIYTIKSDKAVKELGATCEARLLLGRSKLTCA